jgi:formylglycine-generating enzyme required for sulfatase activity
MVRQAGLRILALVLITACASATLRAQEPKKVALLVGVNKYYKERFRDLCDAERDVQDIGAALRDLGFTVDPLKGSNATRQNIKDHLDQLLEGKFAGDPRPGEGIGKGDIVVVMFSGHGQQLRVDGDKDDEPFFCPYDGVPGQWKDLVRLNAIVEKLQAYRGQNLVLIDACRDRNDPSRGSRGTESESRFITAKVGTAVLFSCSAGEQSWEERDVPGGHGFFSECVLKGLHGRAFARGVLTWQRLVADVCDAMNHDPTVVTRLRNAAKGFGGNGNETQTPKMLTSEIGSVPLAWTRPWLPPGWHAFDTNEKRFLATDPQERVEAEAATLLVGDNQRLPRVLRYEDHLAEPVSLRLIEGRPPFYILETKVWNDLYAQFASERKEAGNAWQDGLQKKFADSGRLPVTNVSAIEANAFCGWLKDKLFKNEPVTVRLPTREEWDRAAGYDKWIKGGKPDDAGPFKPGAKPQVAVYDDKPWPVGTAPDDVSPFLVKDMAGNGLEWTDNLMNGDFIHDGIAGDQTGSVDLRGQHCKAHAPLTYAKIRRSGKQRANTPHEWIGFRFVIQVPAEQ